MDLEVGKCGKMLGKIIELKDFMDVNGIFQRQAQCTDFDVFFLEQVLGRYVCSFALSLFAKNVDIST